MSINNTSNVPTRRIGDANIFQASTLSNLNELPTNGNLNIKTNIDDLHLYDNTILENSVLYSTLEQANVTQGGTGPNVNSESGQYVFQFTTPNWSNNREYHLEIPVNLEVELPGTLYYQQDPAYINNTKAGAFYQSWTFADLWNTGNTDPNTRFKHDTSVVESFSGGFYPNEAVIQLFKSFQVYGGTNNQPLGRTSMFYQPNLTNISYGKTSDEDATINGYSGVPLSNTLKRGITGNYGRDNFKFPNNGLEYDTEGILTREINSKAMSSFEATVRMCSSGCGGVNIGADPKNGTAERPVTMKYVNNFVISIPLYKLSEYFRLNVFVPPAMVYKITMDYFTKAVDIYTGSMLRNTGDGQGLNLIQAATFKLSLDYLRGTPQIKYRSMVLTPELQNQLNQRWARNVITYNMESAENVTIPGMQWPYSSTISTSSQRPLNLRICVVATRDSVLPADNVVPNVKYIANQLVPWLDNKYELINIQEITISISGKPVLSIQNLSGNQAGIIPTGYEVINSVMNRRCGNGYSSISGDDQSVRYGTFSGGGAGVPIDISITPNMIWGNGYYPTDQGAVQIKLDIRTNRPLHPDFNISVYKLFTLQLSLDTNIKITQTEWPARVVQNQGISTLQQNSVIPGN